MSNSKLKNLLETFEKEKKELEKQLGEFALESNVPGDYNARFPKHDPDRESNALAVQEMESRKALERELEERLRVVNEAIKKIKAGTYGICEGCSAEIDGRRLKVVPASYLCVACASSRRQ